MLFIKTSIVLFKDVISNAELVKYRVSNYDVYEWQEERMWQRPTEIYYPSMCLS
jgi:hypothetical protein